MSSEATKNSSNSGTKPRVNNEEICQNCKHMTRWEGAGWCKEKQSYTARKNTCESFERRKK